MTYFYHIKGTEHTLLFQMAGLGTLRKYKTKARPNLTKAISKSCSSLIDIRMFRMLQLCTNNIYVPLSLVAFSICSLFPSLWSHSLCTALPGRFIDSDISNILGHPKQFMLHFTALYQASVQGLLLYKPCFCNAPQTQGNYSTTFLCMHLSLFKSHNHVYNTPKHDHPFGMDLGPLKVQAFL